MKKPKNVGPCYQAALKAIMFPFEYRGWTLVHGIAVLTGGDFKGREFGHAWIEKGDMVHDTEKHHDVPKALYYAVGQIAYTVEYTFEQASRLAVEHGHYGPWDEKINNAL